MAHERDNRARKPLTPQRLEEIRLINENKQKKEKAKDLKSIGKWLFFPAVILAILFFISLSVNIEKNSHGISSILIYYTIMYMPAVIPFIILGIWAKKKPYLAFLIGIIIYTTTIILNAIIEPSSLFNGIIIKVLIYLSITKGLITAIKHQKNKQAQNNIIDDIEF